MKEYVTVEFLNQRESQRNTEYTYKNNCKLKVKKGDVVLVATRYGLSIAKVTNLNDDTSVAVEKKVLENLTECSAYFKQVAAQEELKALKARMNKEMKKADERVKYEMYAKADPEFKKLLKEYDKLSETIQEEI